jgi:hypothetical protein
MQILVHEMPEVFSEINNCNKYKEEGNADHTTFDWETTTASSILCHFIRAHAHAATAWGCNRLKIWILISIIFLFFIFFFFFFFFF